MGREWKTSHYKLMLLAVLSLMVSCMPKVEEEEIVPVVTLTSHDITGSNTNVVINLVGSCPVSTYVLRIQVNAGDWNVNNTAQSMTAASGVPIGQCNNGTLLIQYPVPDPFTARPITFRVKARLTDGRSSEEWAIRLVNYVAPTPALPGFAITSVGNSMDGGILSAAGVVTLLAAGGEPVSPNILDSSQTQLRTGLHGVLLE